MKESRLTVLLLSLFCPVLFAEKAETRLGSLCLTTLWLVVWLSWSKCTGCLARATNLWHNRKLQSLWLSWLTWCKPRGWLRATQTERFTKRIRTCSRLLSCPICRFTHRNRHRLMIRTLVVLIVYAKRKLALLRFCSRHFEQIWIGRIIGGKHILRLLLSFVSTKEIEPA